MARKIFGWFLVLAAIALGVYAALAAHSLEAIYGDPEGGVLSTVAGPFTGLFVAMLALASALLLGGMALAGHRRVWLPTLALFLVVTVLAVGIGTWTGLEAKQRYLDEQGVGMRQDGVRGASVTDARGLARASGPTHGPA
jgi:hypothetical protein